MLSLLVRLCCAVERLHLVGVVIPRDVVSQFGARHDDSSAFAMSPDAGVWRGSSGHGLVPSWRSS